MHHNTQRIWGATALDYSFDDVFSVFGNGQKLAVFTTNQLIVPVPFVVFPGIVGRQQIFDALYDGLLRGGIEHYIDPVRPFTQATGICTYPYIKLGTVVQLPGRRAGLLSLPQVIIVPRGEKQLCYLARTILERTLAGLNDWFCRNRIRKDVHLGRIRPFTWTRLAPY